MSLHKHGTFQTKSEKKNYRPRYFQTEGARYIKCTQLCKQVTATCQCNKLPIYECITVHQGQEHILLGALVSTYLDIGLEPAFHRSSQTLQFFEHYQKQKTPEIIT